MLIKKINMGTLHWAEVNGRLECVHFEIRHGTGPRPVTTTLLRKLNLGRQITRWRRQLVIDADMVLKVKTGG